MTSPSQPRPSTPDQQRETDELGLLGTAPQRSGILTGAVVGGLIGALLLGPFGFIEWGGTDVGLGIRLPTLLAIGALAGGSIGAVYAGGRAPELRGDAVDPTRDDPYEPPRQRAS